MKKLLYLFIFLTTIVGTISCNSQGNKGESQVDATDSLINKEAEPDNEPWKIILRHKDIKDLLKL